MAIHVKEFNIEAFKGIRNLSLKELNHINILTGNNNSGKTSILELLNTLKDPYSLGNWISSYRLESVLDIGRYYDYFINLFPVDSIDEEVRYNYFDEIICHRVRVSKSIVNEIMSVEDVASEFKIPIRRLEKRNIIENSAFEVHTLNFEIQKDNEPEVINSISNFQRTIKETQNKSDYNIRYVSPVDHCGQIHLNNILRNNALHDEMIELLKEFDENIIDIVAVGSYTQISYMIRTKNHNNALPLNFYGDGIKKVLLLISAMIDSKNGILLLDEFETAIHTSAMDHIFTWLLNSAIKLNVQVFLTSHSKEAINKVLRCDEGLSDKISYYTLFNYEGKNLVRKLSCSEAIKLQDQGGMDIR